MKQYRTVNNLMGWLTFIIAATVYCLTIEPTASFWDCPEFITTGYKLEVGHPPGAPFFMLVANLFSQFASDVTTVAKMVNYMSALMSGACILFLFWSITHLVRKLIITDENNITKGQLITVMGSGLIGALVYTFSDTFWFSAVEGEVYAFSSLFTAVVFWLILKWEDVADQPHSDRWIILIAYLTGLSIGVHLLNLLCLPAIVLVYYYKKTPNATAKGSLIALFGSMVLVAAVLYGIVPGIVKVGGWFELLFVNGLGMSFNSGVVVYIILLAAALIWGVYESYTEKNKTRMAISFILTIALLGIPFYGHGASSIVIGILVIAALGLYLAPNIQTKIKEKWRISARTMNTALLCTMMIVIGYSSYALIVIRSTANTPMDQNSPEDIFTLGEYLGREQYGTRPLFYGPAFSSKVALDVKDGYCIPRQSEAGSKFVRKEKTSPDEKDSYIELPGRVEYEYAQNMLFPRMYSSSHAPLYKQWVDIKGYDVPYDQCGEMVMVNMPTQWENIKFFFTYQLNFMYWRYFMWNFAGRQNDIQGSGEIEHGNWITGIPFIDNILVGNQELLPQDLKDNKGHNVFYCLPLILGLIGLFWQAYRNQRGIQQFWVVFFLFFMTGIAIVLYLNQTPAQPRERDYAYAGSFYAFAIWVGMGVAGLIQWCSRMKPEQRLIAGATEEEAEKIRKTLEEKRAKFITEEEEAELQYKLDSLYETYVPYKPSAAMACILSIICLLVPIQMASQTWDDHDRSNRYTCRDFGANYLMTLPDKGNPIIFCNGDNDTFPLWYNQDTEEVRRDVRICNLSYAQTDWYIYQQQCPLYDAPGLPISWDQNQYQEGKNEYVAVRPELKKQIEALYQKHPEEARDSFGNDPYEIKNILKYWVFAEKQEFHVIPTDTINIYIDKDAVLRSGMMLPEAIRHLKGEELRDAIPDKLSISLKNIRLLTKVDLLMLEILANCNWERPLYMAISVGNSSKLKFDDYFVQEGLAFRFTPFNYKEWGDVEEGNGYAIDTEKLYENVMNRYKYGGLDTPGLYLDETTLRICYSHRRLFAQLAKELVKQGDDIRARKVLEYAGQTIPAYNVPEVYESGSYDIATAYASIGETQKATDLLNHLIAESENYIDWAFSLGDNRIGMVQQDCLYRFWQWNQCNELLKSMDKKRYEQSNQQFEKKYMRFTQLMNYHN